MLSNTAFLPLPIPPTVRMRSARVNGGSWCMRSCTSQDRAMAPTHWWDSHPYISLRLS